MTNYDDVFEVVDILNILVISYLTSYIITSCFEICL